MRHCRMLHLIRVTLFAIHPAFLDTSPGSQMVLFMDKFKDKYGKELRCPNI